MDRRSWAYLWFVPLLAAVAGLGHTVGELAGGGGGGRTLSVSSRWVVREYWDDDAGGPQVVRVKLACVNWAGHLESMLAEGLNRQPLHRLVLAIKGLGFNCVRLTWATRMFTRHNTTKVWERLEALNRGGGGGGGSWSWVMRGILIHNPWVVNTSLPDAFKEVVTGVARAGMYVIADNHVTEAGRRDAGAEGFWGEPGFGVQEWLDGLTAMASSVPDGLLAGISLRNELRGPAQNTSAWFEFMSMGADAVSRANANLLIFISGLNQDTDLHFLSSTTSSSSINATSAQQKKLVYEMHWYASSYGVNFGQGNLNQACAIATSTLIASGAFMASSTSTPASTNKSRSSSFVAPLFISEFGIDQRGGDKASNRYINCLFAFMARLDLDWAYWALQGSYYTRNGSEEDDEEYSGIFNAKWNAPRNMTFLAKLQAMQQPWKGYDDEGSGASRDYHILFHPSTGLCVQRGSDNRVELGPCTPTHAAHLHRTSAQGRLDLVNSYLCIAAEGDGQLAKFDVIGTQRNGAWDLVSVAKLQFGTRILRSAENMGKMLNVDEDHKDGSYIEGHSDHQSGSNPGVLLCLDGSSPPLVSTRKCVCVLDDGVDCGRDDDPSSQWFVLVSSNLQHTPNISHPMPVPKSHSTATL